MNLTISNRSRFKNLDLEAQNTKTITDNKNQEEVNLFGNKLCLVPPSIPHNIINRNATLSISLEEKLNKDFISSWLIIGDFMLKHLEMNPNQLEKEIFKITKNSFSINLADCDYKKTQIEKGKFSLAVKLIRLYPVINIVIDMILYDKCLALTLPPAAVDCEEAISRRQIINNRFILVCLFVNIISNFVLNIIANFLDFADYFYKGLIGSLMKNLILAIPVLHALANISQKCKGPDSGLMQFEILNTAGVILLWKFLLDSIPYLLVFAMLLYDKKCTQNSQVTDFSINDVIKSGVLLYNKLSDEQKTIKYVPLGNNKYVPFEQEEERACLICLSNENRNNETIVDLSTFTTFCVTCLEESYAKGNNRHPITHCEQYHTIIIKPDQRQYSGKTWRTKKL